MHVGNESVIVRVVLIDYLSFLKVQSLIVVKTAEVECMMGTLYLTPNGSILLTHPQGKHLNRFSHHAKSSNGDVAVATGTC